MGNSNSSVFDECSNEFELVIRVAKVLDLELDRILDLAPGIRYGLTGKINKAANWMSLPFIA